MSTPPIAIPKALSSAVQTKIKSFSTPVLKLIFGPLLDDIDKITTPIVNGSTDYFDVVTSSQITNTLAKGIDNCCRRFVTFKVSCTLCDKKYDTKEEEEKQRQTTTRKSIYTVFQRYSDNIDTHVMCVSHYESDDHLFANLIGACTFVSADSVRKLRLIANNYRDGGKETLLSREDEIWSVSFGW
jgi:hypothetical protein